MNTNYYVRFAQAYGQNSYNTCVYNDTTSCQTSGTGGTSNSGDSQSPQSGGLSNTGLLLLVIVSVACLIAFAALVVRLWRRPNSSKQLAEEVVAENESDRPGSSSVV
jgi:hypothetical protein